MYTLILHAKTDDPKTSRTLQTLQTLLAFQLCAGKQQASL
jgi:hypothetical protein